MRIDFPLKRSSAAALSDRIATRSSTAFRAIDWGTCLAALASPVRLLEMRGISSSDLPSSSRIETRSTFMIWNVKSTTLSSRRSSSCCFDSSFDTSSNRESFFSPRSAFDAWLGAREFGGGHDLRPREGSSHFFDTKGHFPEGHDVVGSRLSLGDLGAVQERAVRRAEVGDPDAAFGEHDFGVPAGDRGVVDGDVARDRAPHHELAPELEVDRLFAGCAQQLEHRPEANHPLWSARAPEAQLVPSPRFPRTHVRGLSPRRFRRPPVRRPGP